MLRLKIQLLVALFFTLATDGQFAVAQQLGGFQSSPEMVEVVTQAVPDPSPAGSPFEVFVRLKIEEGWKLNSHRPKQDYLIGTTLTLEPLAGFAVDEIVYPEGSLKKLDFSEEPMAVYEKQVEIAVRLRSTAATPPGEYVLQGSLRVQACSGDVCLPPGQKPVTVLLRIAQAEPGAAPAQPASPAEAEPLEAAVTPAGTSLPPASSDGGAAGSTIAAMFEKQGTILAFLGIFLMGLALNLTPCVYPMLSITVSLFGGQAGGERRFGRSFGMATAYVLGIVSMYTALGVVAAFSGAMFGGWLQSPYVLIGIGVLFLLLALSMFGLYELQVPPALMNKLGGAQQVTGTLGYYLSGLVVGVFAAPCIGPPIIALLAYVAARGEPWFSVAAFFVLALGLGFPYLILGAFSGLLSKMPKSGEWMIWIRKLFGVILIGFALHYILLALWREQAAWVAPATMLLGGFYLGFLERSAAANRWFTALKWVVGTAGIVFGAFLAAKVYQHGQEQVAMHWEPYSEQRVEQALAAGKPVVFDFSADWCGPCRELEEKTFSDPRVVAATEHYARLKVDLTTSSPETDALRQYYNVAGVPTVVFLDPDGQERSAARVTGFVGPDEFLKRVRAD